MKKTALPILAGILVLASTALAGQSIGLQADLMGQGLSYRIMTANGYGAELVARGRMDLVDSTYNFGAELRLLKLFNLDKRLRFYAGAGAGFWQVNDRYYAGIDATDSSDIFELFTQQGFSAAAIFGLDILLFQFSDGSGISIAPEIQFGYYSLPGSYYYPLYGEEKAMDYGPPEPSRFISPGAGIGLKYNF